MKKNNTSWISIGTVLGDTNIDTFYFSLKKYNAKKGDIVTTESKVPTGEGNIIPVTVWGKIMSIESSNQFFNAGKVEKAFNNAKAKGLKDPQNYMYMYSQDKKDYFKNIMFSVN